MTTTQNYQKFPNFQKSQNFRNFQKSSILEMVRQTVPVENLGTQTLSVNTTQNFPKIPKKSKFPKNPNFQKVKFISETAKDGAKSMPNITRKCL